MKSKTAEMASMDCVETSNMFLGEVINLDAEPQIDLTLSSQDLLLVDSSNLFVLDEVKNFSNELLEMIASSRTEDFAVKVPKAKVVSLDEKLGKVQQEVMTDITAPLHSMFDEFACFVTEAIA